MKCKYYFADEGWCTKFSDFSIAMPIVKYCPKSSCEYYEEEPEPPRWLTTEAYPHHLYCSECYKTFVPNVEWIGMYNIPTKFCPNCGVKMEGE